MAKDTVSKQRETWRSWRGALAGTEALADHLKEHAEEVARELSS